MQIQHDKNNSGNTPSFTPDKQLFFIAGPCVIESEQLCFEIAEFLLSCTERFKVTFIFKSSYDKANRTSLHSFRGVGIDQGLKILHTIATQYNLLTLTDIHTADEAALAAEVVDILQIPAFLCRQTDLLCAAGKTGKWVNIKKGQFLAPNDMCYAVEKAGAKSLITERGTFFGYNKLVVDFTGIHIMKKNNVPIIFDATHSVQQPGNGTGKTSGNREYAIGLARAALCQGIQGLFFEIHPNPTLALSDADNCISLQTFEKHIPHLIELYHTIQAWDQENTGHMP